MQQAEAEVIGFEHARREGGFIASVNFRMPCSPRTDLVVKRRIFGTGKRLSIDCPGTVSDTLSLVGVPDGTTFNRWNGVRRRYEACKVCEVAE